MATQRLEDLDLYRNPTNALRAGLDVAELPAERIVVNPDGTAAGSPGRQFPVTEPRNNPNVGSGGSAEARGFRQRGAAPAVTPDATTATRLQRAGAAAARVGAGARGLAAAAVPAVAGTAAFGAVDRAAAPSGTGPGTALRPGQVPIPNDPSLNPTAPPAADPSFFRDTEAGRNIGNVVNAVGAGRIAASAARGAGALVARNPTLASPIARAADMAVQGIAAANATGAALPGAAGSDALASTSPRGAGGGRGLVNPAAVDPNAAIPPTGGTTEPAAAAATPAGSTDTGVQTISDFDRQLAAEGAQRQAREAAGNATPASLGSGFGARLAALNRETTAASLRNDARLGYGSSRALNAQADTVLAQNEADAQRQAQADALAVQTNAATAQRQAADATTRRGQDIEAASRREAGAVARDVARIGGDARVEAAEARGFRAAGGVPRVAAINLPDTLAADGITVLKGGQVLYDQATGNIIRPNGGTATAPAAAGGAAVTPKAEYDKLPKGARYVGPDGKTYIKG